MVSPLQSCSAHFFLDTQDRGEDFFQTVFIPSSLAAFPPISSSLSLNLSLSEAVRSASSI
jgi:hypothetical protein